MNMKEERQREDVLKGKEEERLKLLRIQAELEMEKKQKSLLKVEAGAEIRQTLQLKERLTHETAKQ